jgi:hypothetical protein
MRRVSAKKTDEPRQLAALDAELKAYGAKQGKKVGIKERVQNPSWSAL